MATTLFFPPPSALPTSTPDRIPLDEGDEDSGIYSTLYFPPNPDVTPESGAVHAETSPVGSPGPDVGDVVRDDVDLEAEDEGVDVDVEGVNDVEGSSPRGNDPQSPNTIEVDQSPGGAGPDGGSGRRVTLKPRRTLSLSPTPGRGGDMMARNLRAARWLDFTNEDDDDGLYQGSDSDTEAKRKSISFLDECISGGVGKLRLARSFTLGTMTGLSRGDFLAPRRPASSMKRPLEHTLPCQEIHYLDIPYQNVGINSVQFSPIPRKKIAYHQVSYHSIDYCDVPYVAERPSKRKPPA